jgi:nucleotide-binding universal stress UspA family protein
MKIEKLLVPTDFSDAAGRAFSQALLLAPSGAGEILVLHRLASPLPIVSPVGLGAGFPEMGRLLDEYTKELRDEASRKLRDLAGRAPEGVAVETAIEERLEPREAILKIAADRKMDLIVMGTHGRRGLDRLMGSVASAVLHRAEQQVLLVRPDSELFSGGPDHGSILVPVDFSDHAHRALAAARLLSSRYQVKLHLLHVVELVHTPLKPGGLTSPLQESPGMREKCEGALRDMLGTTPGEVTVADGTVAGEILWWREKLGARLVVMGSRGLTGLKHLLLGSVAETVARFCEVPVLVVK